MKNTSLDTVMKTPTACSSARSLWKRFVLARCPLGFAQGKGEPGGPGAEEASLPTALSLPKGKD